MTHVSRVSSALAIDDHWFRSREGR
jgi:hypothetical protein